MGHFDYFPSSYLHSFALMNCKSSVNVKLLGLSLPGCLATAKQIEAKYPLAVFTWLQLDWHLSSLGGQRPTSCWVNTPADWHKNLYYSCKKKKCWRKTNNGSELQLFLLSAHRQHRNIICFSFAPFLQSYIKGPLILKWLESLWKGSEPNAPSMMGQFSLRVQWEKMGERF